MQDEFERLLDEGFEEFHEGRYDEADRLCEAARKLWPTSGRPLVLEARSQMMQGLMQEAHDKLLKALEIEPECTQAYETFASMRSVYAGDHLGAVHFLLYALQINPERQRTWNRLLNNILPLELADVTKDIARAAALRATGDEPEDYSLRCMAYRALDDDEKFANEAKRFIEEYPSDRMAQLNAILAGRSTNTEEEPEDEQLDDSGIKRMIEAFAESLNVDDGVRAGIERMWKLFLDRAVPEPEL